jgi:hypothetical protein
MRRFSAETHLEIRTLKEHLEALAAREMFRMALRDKGLKTYDFWRSAAAGTRATAGRPATGVLSRPGQLLSLRTRY